MVARKRKEKLVAPGYVIDEFGTLNNQGYGNLTGIKFTQGQAIKMFCLSCCGGHEFDWRKGDGTIELHTRPTDEVRECAATTCYLWPFRMGRNPNRAHVKGDLSNLTARSTGP